MAAAWSVVGGAESGGIVVRAGRDTSSVQFGSRLAKGALVEELELLGERLNYRLLSGTGPSSGWVSTRFKGKELLVRSAGAGAGAAAGLSGATAEAMISPFPTGEEEDDFGEDVVFDASGSVHGVIDVDERIRGPCLHVGCKMFRKAPEGTTGPEALRRCSRCGQYAAEHLDRGGAGDEEETGGDVVVNCRSAGAFPQGSVLEVFHVSLPAGSDVGKLRAVLWGKLPPGARVLSQESWTWMKELQDSDPVPEKVILSDLRVPVDFVDVITKSQAQECQRLLQERLSTTEAQTRLAELEETCRDNPAKFRTQLQKYLRSEVYPDVTDSFELPQGAKTAMVVMNAISQHATGDRGMMETWLRLETLMRNPTGIVQAKGALVQLGFGSSL